MSEEVLIEDPEAVLAALERAKADAKKYREQAKEAESKLAEIDALKQELDGVRENLRQSAIRAKLIDLNVDQRVTKYLDLSNVTLDDTGEAVGIEDALANTQNELPELFDPKRRVSGLVDLNTAREAKVEKTATEIQVDRLMGLG